jgi:hypothetical protein
MEHGVSMGKKEKMVEYVQEFAESGISVIPVNGKKPIPVKWQRFSEETPSDEEIESWNYNKATGVGLVLGAVSNICCVDIDEENPEILKKLLKELPNSPVVKKGKRGETRFFRLYNDRGSYITPLFSTKHALRNQFGEHSIDLMASSCMTVIPPSEHPDGGDFMWTGEEFGPSYDIDCLPVCDFQEVEHIAQMCYRNVQSSIINKAVSPVGTQRHNKMKRMVATMIGQNLPIDFCIKKMEEYDSEISTDVLYFADPEKGNYVRKGQPGDYYYNILKMYLGELRFINDKRRMENKILQLPLMSDEVKIEEAERPLPKFGPVMDITKNAEIPVFNQDLIPPLWRKWVIESARVTGVPVESIFFAALTGLSSLLGNKVIVRSMQENESWEESVNIWTVYVAKSGTRKSQIVNIAFKALRDIQKVEDEKYKEKVAAQELTNESIDVQIKKLKADHAKMLANPNTFTEDLRKLEKTIVDLEMKKIKVPYSQTIVNTATPERLIDVFKDNPMGVLIFENELGALADRFKKKGYELLKGIMLDSWDGTNSFSYQTKSGGKVSIDTLCSSCYFNSQPGVIEKMLQDISHTKRDDGFLERSLIIRRVEKIYDIVDEKYSYDNYKEAYDIFHKAHNLSGRAVVKTDPLAYLELKLFLERNAKRIHDEKESMLSSYWGKLSGNVVAVSFLLEYLKTEGQINNISKGSMLDAIQILEDYNVKYIRNTIQDALSKVTPMAKELAYLIEIGSIADDMSFREIHRNNQRVFKSAEDVKLAVDKLEEHNYVISYRDGKSRRIRINPELLQQ